MNKRKILDRLARISAGRQSRSVFFKYIFFFFFHFLLTLLSSFPLLYLFWPPPSYLLFPGSYLFHSQQRARSLERSCGAVRNCLAERFNKRGREVARGENSLGEWTSVPRVGKSEFNHSTRQGSEPWDSYSTTRPMPLVFLGPDRAAYME